MNTQWENKDFNSPELAQARSMAHRARFYEMQRIWLQLKGKVGEWRGFGDKAAEACAGMSAARVA